MAPPPAQTRIRIASASLLLMACACCIPVDAVPRNTTIYNNRPRYNMRGQFVDAHDGVILAHTFPNGSTFYFLYGEFYNLTSGGAYPSSWGRYPQLSVYTSDDMSSWSYRGQAVSDGRLSSSSKWIPNVFYDAQRGRFVMWYVAPSKWYRIMAFRLRLTTYRPAVYFRLRLNRNPPNASVSQSTAKKGPDPPF